MNFNKLLDFFKNKYVITILVVLVWTIFLDANGLISQIKLHRELKDLRTKKEYLKKQIEKNKKEINLLRNDPAYLEKEAREKYLMKRDQEDIFIFEEE